MTPVAYQLDSNRQRDFALDIVRKLRKAGFVAYWAGGCVRDLLLGRQPKDYDVATSATPEQIRDLFGHRRTLAVGAAFGVIVVVGPKRAGTVEVTTFRSEAPYSDGRHPDAVSFTTAEADAQRRDFTINGLFYDPLAERPEARVIDYVDGVEDLRRGVVRAIGEPRERFSEDKLRLLRAVRFAATFDFELDPATRQAVCELAPTITVVSVERISQEMRLMLVHTNRSKALRLLDETNLLDVLLPELVPLNRLPDEGPNGSLWAHTLAVVEQLREPSFPLALAALLHEAGRAVAAADASETAMIDRASGVGEESAQGKAALGARVAEEICLRWRLSNKETERVCWLVAHQADLVQAPRMPWSQLQPILTCEGIEELLALHEAESLARGADTAAVEYCRQLLRRPQAELNPPPLVTGDDLIQHGVPPGKIYKLLLDKVRSAQLDGAISTRSEALKLVDQLLAQVRQWP